MPFYNSIESMIMIHPHGARIRSAETEDRVTKRNPDVGRRPMSGFLVIYYDVLKKLFQRVNLPVREVSPLTL